MKKFIRILLAMAICSSNFACGQMTKSNDYPTVTPAVFLKDILDRKDAYVLDVRTPQEFDEGHLADAHNLDWLDPAEFEAGLPTLPKDQTIYIYCRSGGRSAQASQFLSQRGYKVVNLDGGFADLQRLSH